MMPTSTKDRDLHAKALQRFNNIAWALHDERDYMMADRRFVFISGAQWEGNLFEQFQNKPRFEVNKIRMSVMKIANEYRQNRMTVDFTPASGKGEPDDKMADFLDGAYRAMEYDSGAIEAYDNAFDEALAGGFGAFRFVTRYEDEFDEDNEHQTVRMEPIYDACRSVYFDLQAKRQDKRDARYGFIISSMTHEAYKLEHGDCDFSTWPVDSQTSQFDWYTPDVIYIAEYFLIEKEDYTLHIYTDEDGEVIKYRDEDFDADEGLQDKIEARGLLFVKKRKLKRRIVNKYVMSGAGILEGPQKLAGKHIPIIPVYGQRAFIDNLERCCGHVRPAKDSQRLMNIQLSRVGELAMISPYSKPIVTAEQIAGHEEEWAEDNLKNYPFLQINPIMDSAGNEVATGPVGYTKPPEIQPAVAALVQITSADLKELLGNQEQGEKIAPNTSAQAISLVQGSLDMSTAIYLDNMRKGVLRGGEVWFSMIQDIYVEEGRDIKIIASNGAKSSVKLGRKITNETGEVVPELDLANAKYDVEVNVGPTSASKRDALVSKLIATSAVTDDPATRKVLTHVIIANLEGEGMEDTRAWSRRELLQLGAAEPTEEEARQMAEAKEQQQPSPQDKYLDAEADLSEVKAKKVAAEADKVVAETEQLEIDSKKTQAQTFEIMSNVEREDVAKAIEILGRFSPDAQSVPARNGMSNTGQ